MSLPHASHRSSPPGHSQSRGRGPLAIAAAFAGGIACTVVAMAMVSGTLNSLLPGAERGAVATSSSSSGNGQPAAKSSGADHAAKSAAADEQGCRDRAWPSPDQRCPAHTMPDPAPPSRASSRQTTGVAPSPAEERGDNRPSTAEAPHAPQTAAQQPDPQAHPDAPARTAATRRQQQRQAARQERRERREARQRARDRDAADDNRRERDAGVSRTYRSAADREWREAMEQSGRRPYARYHSEGRGFFTAD